jgi:putative peptide zinc metalloprotease protein
MMQVERSEAGATTRDLVPERPVPAADVEMVGELRDSAFQDGQWLVQRGGRFVQLSEPLYRVVEYANGERTADEIAALVAGATDLAVTGEHVRQMLERKLIPLAIVEAEEADTPAPTVPEQAAADLRSMSPLTVNVRLKVLGPRVIDPITALLRHLYHPAALVPLLLAIGIGHWWIYAAHGVSTAFRAAVSTPGAVVAVFGLYLLSGAMHELGHASALRYGGGRARAIGIGIYLIYPIYYTDTTDGYRLGRWGRVRTDLGGFYFHLVFALAVLGAYVGSGQEWLLLVVLLIDLDITRQLFPFVRLDGYWALTDLLGVPDILSHMKSTLGRALEQRGRPVGVPALKPWATIVFSAYTLVTVPLLGALMVVTLVEAPYILASVWHGLLINLYQLRAAMADREQWVALAAGAGSVLLAIQVVGIVLLVLTIAWQPMRALWRWSGPRTMRRLVAGALGGAAACAILSYWASTLSQLR